MLDYCPSLRAYTSWGYLSQQAYKAHVRKYSESLKEEPQPLTLEQRRSQEEQQRIEKTLMDAWKEWPNLSEKARVFHLKTARDHPDLPISILVLEKATEAPNG